MGLPANTTTYDDISPRTKGAAKRKLLERGQHLMVIERFGQIDPQPKNSTKTRMWRRYNSLPRASAPLAEGIPPTGHKLTYTDVTATLEMYGDVVKLTRIITDTHEDPVLSDTMDNCGQQAAETIEEMRINVAKGGSNVFYANSVTSRATVNSPPLRGDFRRIYRYLKAHKAREVSKINKASALISTEPVMPAYYVLASTDLDADIRAIPGFIPYQNYSDSDKAIPGEIGAVEQFRFVLTPMFEPWSASGASGTEYLSGGAAVTTAASADVYPMLIFSENCFGIVPLQGMESVDIAVINPGKPTKDDPHGQIGFVSWFTYQAAAILNQTWLVRYEVCATSNP